MNALITPAFKTRRHRPTIGADHHLLDAIIEQPESSSRDTITHGGRTYRAAGYRVIDGDHLDAHGPAATLEAAKAQVRAEIHKAPVVRPVGDRSPAFAYRWVAVAALDETGCPTIDLFQAPHDF